MIPEKLRKQEFRFILVKPKDKRPIETKWTTENNYEWNDWKLEKHIHYNNNYGIVTGFDNLIVIDFDDKDMQDKFMHQLPETFTVQAGGGLNHLYFTTDNPKTIKILGEGGKTLIDVQGNGRFIVAPGSIHPSGNKYKVVKDIPIKYIKMDALSYLFKEYIQKEDKKKIKEKKVEKDPLLKEIKEKVTMSKLLQHYGIDTSNNPTSCLWHTSQKDKCLSFDDNTYYCFHCLETGNVFHFMMKQENCDFLTAKRKLADFAGIKDLFMFDYFDKITNYVECMKEFIKKQPVHYDTARLWWVWNFHEYRWVMMDETDLMNFINQHTKNPTTNSTIRNELLEALKQVGRLNKPKPIKTTWIQFNDIIVDFETGEEFEATPEFFVTNPIPWELGDTDETITMDLIFEDWVGKENTQTLYEIIAYCLLLHYPIHRLFCLLGEGLNGKSSFLNLLKIFLGGDNCTSTELDLLLKSRFEVTKLHKKLLCVMGETNFSEMTRTSLLKKLVGGDLIGFEYKNKTPFDDVNYAKIVIATNNLPSTTDKTIGFYRRWIIIDFPNKFSEKKDILKEIPTIEFNNLARKSLMVLKNLLDKREFHNEGTIEEREKKYEEKSNPLQKFWDENVEEDFNTHIFKFVFRERLDDFCKENRFRILSDQAINKFMGEKHIEGGKQYTEWHTDEGEKKQYRSWNGIKLQDQ